MCNPWKKTFTLAPLIVISPNNKIIITLMSIEIRPRLVNESIEKMVEFF
jgi:hypothetical protein